jgi:hypothetical protein
MKRILAGCLIALAGHLTLATGTVRAQAFIPPQYGPGYRPLLSPYLYLNNLNNVNGATNPGLNYFLFTQPEFQRRAQYNELRLGLNELAAQTLIPPAPGGPPITAEFDLPRPLAQSGHPTYFNNTAGYFGGRVGRALAPPTGVGYQQRPRPGSGR